MGGKGLLLIAGGGLVLYWLSQQASQAVAPATGSGSTAPAPGSGPAPGTTPAPAPTAPASTSPPPAPTSHATPTDVISVTGLTVHPDINNSLTGTILVNGSPVTLSIIQTPGDGRVFNTNGQDITQQLASAGVDVAGLGTAFATAPLATSGTSGLAGLGAGQFVDPYAPKPVRYFGPPPRTSAYSPYGGWFQ